MSHLFYNIIFSNIIHAMKIIKYHHINCKVVLVIHVLVVSVIYNLFVIVILVLIVLVGVVLVIFCIITYHESYT